MRNILIVGATAAIAAACARIWASQGARLFLVARNEEKLQALAGDLNVRGAEWVRTFRMSAEETPKHAEMLAAALESLGGIDIALIAHGTLPNQGACEADAGLTL